MNKKNSGENTFSIAFKEPQTLRERIYIGLREAITNKTLSPGERITENKIAKELNVSITPVREALLQLSVEGFVEVKTHKNVVVKQFSSEEVTELYELQGLIEGYAARKSSLNMNDDDLLKLRKLTDEMGSYFKSNNVEKFYETNQKIHELYLMKCGNNSIFDLVSSLNLRKKMFSYRVTFLAKKNAMKKSLDDHVKILNAFLSHDLDVIEKIVREHWISDSHIKEFEESNMNESVED